MSRNLLNRRPRFTQTPPRTRLEENDQVTHESEEDATHLRTPYVDVAEVPCGWTAWSAVWGGRTADGASSRYQASTKTSWIVNER